MAHRKISKQKVIQIAHRLDDAYPRTELHNLQDPLEEAIFILLSSQTNEAKYVSTWYAFSKAFPTPESALSASEEEIYKVICAGGLGRWKARRIKNLLTQVFERYGEISLNKLASLSDFALEKELIKLDGLGIKGARCIMMYSFGRQVLPVDVHVARVVKRLGFIIPHAGNRSREFADGIQEQVPPELRHRLHINLIQHGRTICRPQHPKCKMCIINDICNYGIKELH